jgi:DnaJ family protein C protein 28
MIEREQGPGRRREGQDEGRHLRDYIEEQIRDAQERGLFDHLPGMGRPLKLSENPYAGDQELSYHLLQSNGFAPREVALAAEIREELATLHQRLARLQQRRARLSARRVPPFPSEKRAFNAALAHTLQAYEAALRELNRKILTLSLIAPPAMHMAMLDVERMVENFRQACPPLP